MITLLGLHFDLPPLDVFRGCFPDCSDTQYRALTPLFGNGAGAHGIGRVSDVFTKIGKFDIVLEVSIARLIPTYCSVL